MPAPRRHDQSGFQLLELTVTSVIVFIVLSSFFTMVGYSSASIGRIMAMSSSDQIYFDLKKAVNDLQSLKITRLRDAVFNACFATGAMSNVSLCPAQQTLPLSYFDRDGNQIAGPPAAPIYYTVTGSRCDRASEQCPLAAVSTVRAQGYPAYGSNLLQVVPWTSNKWRHEIIEVILEIRPLGRQISINRTLSGTIVLQVSDFGVTP